MLWYADALAGVVREQLSTGSLPYFADLRRRGTLVEVEYLG
ncbi:hypothetical protein [Candidatus Poriferisodalis sp.]